MTSPPSFIESPFSTRAEYDTFLALPAGEQQAALDAAATKCEAPAAIDGLAAAAAGLSVEEVAFGPMEYPPARIAAIKAKFESEADPQGRLPLKRVHQLLFTHEERSEYDFDTWDTDLQATCEGCKKFMTFADVTKFLEDNL